MEKIKAVVVQDSEKYFISVEVNRPPIRIPMSEDKPKEVKSAFNKLLARLKDGVFQIELDGVGEDLFSQVANEYVLQLNREIIGVYAEMKEHGLVNN